MAVWRLPSNFYSNIVPKLKMSEEIQLLLRKLDRERRARLQAEMLLEQKSLELYEANKDLTKFAEDLEDQVKIRTEELVSARDEALMSCGHEGENRKSAVNPRVGE